MRQINKISHIIKTAGNKFYGNVDTSVVLIVPVIDEPIDYVITDRQVNRVVRIIFSAAVCTEFGSGDYIGMQQILSVSGA